MFLRIGHAGRTIGQIFAEFIARNNHQADVDPSLAEGGVQVDHVHDQQVTPRGHLHLDANANAGTVHDLALNPVHIAGNLLGPAAETVELLVN
jgi:hypothetical protein